MNSSYLTGNPEQLFEKAPQAVKDLIVGSVVNDTTAILGKSYKIPVSSYVAFENIISYVLIGAILPENAVKAIIDILKLDEETAYKLAVDLDKTVLEKARISILGKSPKDMVTLTFPEGRSPEELRKEILDTTNREVVTPAAPQPVAQAAAKTNILTGSRSQLMEQLKILDDIPDDDEISERLKKIQEQITSINAKDERALDSTVALQEFMPKDTNNEVVTPELKAATYSQAPTKYNVDPYREVPADS